MAQQILLTLDKQRVTTAPGAKTECSVTIQNLTALLDDVTVTVEGIEPGWIQVVPAHVPVFAQGEASVRVTIQPPPDPAHAAAGIYQLRIGAISQELSGQLPGVSLELEVQFRGDYRMEVGIGTALGPQEANFPVNVHNDGNAPLALRFSGQDERSAFWYKFAPFQLLVPPGGEAAAVLSIRARQPETASQQVVFALSSQGEWTPLATQAISAPLHTASGQWGQAAPTSLAVTVQAYPPGSAKSGRYQVVVANPGPAQETANLEGSSPDGRFKFQFSPPQVILNPLSQATVDLLVSPAVSLPDGADELLNFWVTARPLNPNTRPGSTRARFIRPAQPQKKKRPGWLIPVILLAALILLLCLCSFLGYFLFREQILQLFSGG